MSNSENQRNIVLTLLNGEPHLFNKTTKTYFILYITPEKAIELLKENFTVSSIRPNMKKIWQILALSFNCCDGYSNYFQKKDTLSETSFETIFTKKVTEFLNEIYPPEKTLELIKKKREFEENKRKADTTSANAEKCIKNNQMLIKKGRKLY